MAKRVVLFILTNILVITTISLVVNLLGIRPYLTASGLDLGALAAFALVWGCTGSFISLAISRKMAKWRLGVRVIDPRNPGEFAWLVQSVHDLARHAKLPAMPEVGVYDSPEVNAFATGPTKARSLVAVSRGLLQQMNRDEIEGALAHEVAHIQNGDMVTMTLIQGVVNAFSIFLARVIAYAVAQAMSSREEEGDFSPMVFQIVSIVAEICFTILGTMVVRWFSRQREFPADAGSARLWSEKGKMISTLQRLERIHDLPMEPQPALAAMKISSGNNGGKFSFLSLFSTHPPLAERIARLEQLPL